MTLHPISDGAGFQSYTPVWTTDGTAPSLGNGTLTGRYTTIGKLVFVTVTLIAGSTTTFGTSFWHISLPIPARTITGNGDYGIVGTCWDISAAKQYTGLWRYDNYAFCVLEDGTATRNAPITNSIPMTWADTDRLELGRIYEAA